MKNKIDKIDWKLAEIIGILLGDGHISKVENSIFVSGHTNDEFYYRNRVMPLFEKIFGLMPHFYPVKGKNACLLQLNSKNVHSFLTNEIGLVKGNKINTIVPATILKSKMLQKHFIRGVFDTDGWLKFSKQSKSFHYYPRIRIQFKESIYGKEIGKILSTLGFRFSSWDDTRRENAVFYYEISGDSMLDKWIKEIGICNIVQGSRYLFWRKFGFFETKLTFLERCEKIDLNLATNYINVGAPDSS